MNIVNYRKAGTFATAYLAAFLIGESPQTAPKQISPTAENPSRIEVICNDQVKGPVMLASAGSDCYQVPKPAEDGQVQNTMLANLGDLMKFFGVNRANAQDVAAKSQYNPRDEFRKMGWEVYDDKGLKSQPSDRTYKAKIDPDKLRENFKNPADEYGFSLEETKVIRALLDGDQSNDELKALMVTSDDYLAFAIRTLDSNVGIKGIYSAQKKVTPEIAEIFRKISHRR